MKTKSVFLVVATAVVGLAFVTPEASAHGGRGNPLAHSTHRKSVAKKKAEPAKAAKCECKAKTPASDTRKKTIGLSVKKDARKLRPYFQRKQGASAFRGARGRSGR